MAATFESIINKCKKDWNCDNLMDGVKAERGPKIPFSSPMMNYITYGGIPRRRVSHLYGRFGSGKTTTSIDVCKNAYELFEKEFNEELIRLQELSVSNKSAGVDADELRDRGVKKILYIDLEHSFDGNWSTTLGVDLNKIHIMQPPNVFAEDVLQTVLDLIETGEVGLIVIDSVAALTTKKVLEKDIGEKTVADLAGVMTTFMSKVITLLDRYDCTLILINQIRDNLINPYAVNTPGGQAIKFYSSLMLDFSIGDPVDFLGNELPQKSENPAGYKINVRITKQKTAPFDRKNASYYLMAQSGIRKDMDLAQTALTKYSIIKKSGAWFTFSDPFTGEIICDESTGKALRVQGMAKVYDYLGSHPDYYNLLEQYITGDTNGVSFDVADSAD